MVSSALQSAIEALSLDERSELAGYSESTMESEPIELTGEQKATIRSRAADMDSNPAIGLTWEDLCSRLGSRWA